MLPFLLEALIFPREFYVCINSISESQYLIILFANEPLSVFSV